MEEPVYPNYPEIFKLIDFVKEQRIRTQVLESEAKKISGFALVKFHINRFSQDLFLDNEYKDFNVDKPLLHAELCLAHLEDVEDSEDILQWANWHGLKAGDRHILDYYTDLVAFNDEIRHLFKGQTVQSFVHSFDFELNQKAAQALRKEEFEY